MFAAPMVGQKVLLSHLKETHAFYRSMGSIKRHLYDESVARGYFPASPESVRNAYIAAGVIGAAGGYMGLPVLAVLIGADPFMLTASGIATALLVAFFGPLMPRRTAKGVEAFEHAKGFKEYLSKAEKYRLEWQEKEGIFERFLPHAMVFGVVDRWSNAFKDKQLPPPSWYQGSAFSSGAFNAVAFGSMLRSMDSSVASAMASRPQSSGSGSGFGGGGSSGGGFGGGGGGSW
jgi:uncharacterized membrane protein